VVLHEGLSYFFNDHVLCVLGEDRNLPLLNVTVGVLTFTLGVELVFSIGVILRVLLVTVEPIGFLMIPMVLLLELLRHIL